VISGQFYKNRSCERRNHVGTHLVVYPYQHHGVKQPIGGVVEGGDNRRLFYRVIKKLDLLSPAWITEEIQLGAELVTPNPAPVRMAKLDVG
jgi:hypothetical protein